MIYTPTKRTSKQTKKKWSPLAIDLKLQIKQNILVIKVQQVFEMHTSSLYVSPLAFIGHKHGLRLSG